MRRSCSYGSASLSFYSVHQTFFYFGTFLFKLLIQPFNILLSLLLFISHHFLCLGLVGDKRLSNWFMPVNIGFSWHSNLHVKFHIRKSLVNLLLSTRFALTFKSSRFIEINLLFNLFHLIVINWLKSFNAVNKLLFLLHCGFVYLCAFSGSAHFRFNKTSSSNFLFHLKYFDILIDGLWRILLVKFNKSTIYRHAFPWTLLI